MTDNHRWWHGATVYHVYVRSFADSNGDGYGDLRGLRSRLDYLEWLGVDAIWLSPINPSPDCDWGYDVSDYRDVHPDLGTLDDLENLITDLHGRNMRLVLDLVPNHTSDRHAWFVESRSSRDSPYRDYYVWADAKPDGAPPNNWTDDVGDGAWEWDETTGQFYLHNFLPGQPDLDWRNPAVRSEFDGILDFWFDRGVDGFRIDVANGLVKDRELRDNPPLPDPADPDHPVQGQFGLEHVHNFNQPEVHDVYRSWRRRTELRSDPPLLMGETWVVRVDELAPYYGRHGDGLNLALNFPLIFAPFTPPALSAVIADSLAAFPDDARPVWCGSNHDLPRLGTRWADGDQRRIRMAHLVLGALSGTHVIYYGDELGLSDNEVPADLQRDPLTKGGYHGQWPRDNARAALRWDSTTTAGFGDGTPWLPLTTSPVGDVAAQRGDAGSTLNLVRDLISLRARFGKPDVASYEPIEVTDTLWRFVSGAFAVSANFSDEPVALEDRGEVLLRSGDAPGGTSADVLAPWEAVITTRIA